MKLALGTVQFGLDYGISNLQGKIAISDVNNILTAAKLHGITTLDTAAAYGDSEDILGQLQAGNSFSLVTKIPSLVNQSLSLKSILENSLSRLKTENLQALMFHSANDLLSPLGQQYYRHVKAFKTQKMIKQLGVSVYSPKQLFDIMTSFSIDIVQLPLNCLDQRFVQTKLLQQLKANNIEVHARSIFLQGLLLMPIAELAEYFHPYKHFLIRFYTLCKRLNCQPLTLALSIVHSNPFVSKAVIGCCSAQQLDQIVAHYHLAKELADEGKGLLAELACNDEALINPSNWPI